MKLQFTYSKLLGPISLADWYPSNMRFMGMWSDSAGRTVPLALITLYDPRIHQYGVLFIPSHFYFENV